MAMCNVKVLTQLSRSRQLCGAWKHLLADGFGSLAPLSWSLCHHQEVCLLPVQHQKADTVSKRLWNVAEHLQQQLKRHFPQELLKLRLLWFYWLLYVNKRLLLISSNLMNFMKREYVSVT